MSARAATGVAWVLVGLAATLVALALGFIPANGPLPGEAWPHVSLALGFPVVGALIARRQPRHPIAWVFLVAGTAGALVLFTYGYAQYALVTRPGALPGGTAVAWVSAWVWVLGLTPVATFGLLLFPDGRLPSARWHPLAWVAAAAVVRPSSARPYGRARWPTTRSPATPWASPTPKESWGLPAASAWPASWWPRPAQRQRWWCATAVPEGSSASS